MDRRIIVKNCSGCGTKHAGPFEAGVSNEAWPQWRDQGSTTLRIPDM